MAQELREVQVPMGDKGSGQINSPEITVEGGKLSEGRKAISDELQAKAVFDKLVGDQEKRNQINAEIWEHYTGVEPHNPAELTAMGQDWRYNFPTLFLQGIIDRAVPNFILAIDNAETLTQATLPEKIDDIPVINRDEKVQRFQKRFTKFVRTKWPDYRDFNSVMCQELVLIGYTFGINTDEDTPWPTHYTQAGAFTYERAPQSSQDWQVLAVKEDILMDQLVDQIESVETAKKAGWDVDNCVKSLNASMPLDPGRDLNTNPRSFAEVVRDCTTAMSFVSGAKGVSMGHLFAKEPTKKEGKGRITHWIIDRVTGKTLFERERRFHDMMEVVVPITLEPGNGHLYGSKGLGRILVNLSIAVDELVNDAVSQVKMSGMMVLKTDFKSAMQSQVKVRAPFVIVASDGGTLQKETFKLDADAFLAVYGQLQKLAEIAAGAYIANTLSTTQESSATGARRTAREATIDYTRELQSKSAAIARFVEKYGKGILQRVQARLTRKGNTHPDAKEFYRLLIEEDKLNDKEIELLGASPTIEVIRDLTDTDKQKKAQLCADPTIVGNPMIDQKKRLYTLVSSTTDPQFAAELVIPDAVDPTVEAEQVRQQVIEMYAIKGGAPGMPVSPRDDDKIHLKFLQPNIQKLLVKLMSTDPLKVDPEELDYTSALTVHGEEHINNMEKKGADKAEVKEGKAFYMGAEKLLQAIITGKQKALDDASQVLADQHKIQADQHMAEQMGPQTEQEPPAEPAGQGSEMAEKTLVAWIGKYDSIPDESKAKLLEIGGLGRPATMNVTPVPKPGEEPNDPIATPQLPEPNPDTQVPPPGPGAAPEPGPEPGPGPGGEPPLGPGPGPMPALPEENL